MKLKPVTKLDKGNKTRSENLDNDVMTENCDFIAIFPVCHQVRSIWKPDSALMVCETYIFINSSLSSRTISFSNVTFSPKTNEFLAKKNADISKIKRVFVLKERCSETTYVYELKCKIWNFKHNSNEL